MFGLNPSSSHPEDFRNGIHSFPTVNYEHYTLSTKYISDQADYAVVYDDHDRSDLTRDGRLGFIEDGARIWKEHKKKIKNEGNLHGTQKERQRRETACKLACRVLG